MINFTCWISSKITQSHAWIYLTGKIYQKMEQPALKDTEVDRWNVNGMLIDEIVEHSKNL